MPRLSRRVKLQAKQALRTHVRNEDETIAAPHRRTTSFPYDEGSLVTFRKGWSRYGDISCDTGAICLVMTCPYIAGHNSSVYVVDVMINGTLVEEVPAKILILATEEEE